MTITVKTIKKVLAIIGAAAFILANNLSWARDTVFPDYPIRDLKVIEINVETENVIIESPHGETATLTVGDVVGQESFSVSAIQKTVIELESPPDDSGKTWKSHVPVNQIRSLDDCAFIESKNLKPPFMKNK